MEGHSFLPKGASSSGSPADAFKLLDDPDLDTVNQFIQELKANGMGERPLLSCLAEKNSSIPVKMISLKSYFASWGGGVCKS